jgi:arsenate reductase (glutaredoxin)
MKIYHNTECSKSQGALCILQEISDITGETPEIIEYLKTPPTASELQELLKMLGMKPFDLVRKNEEIYLNNFQGKEFSDEEWIDIMLKHPILIERPIIIHNGKAVIGRPPETVRTLFS